MTTLDIPSSVRVAECEIQLVYPDRAFESPLSGAEQVLELQGAKWMMTYTLVPYRTGSIEAEAIKSFFLKLKGRSNDFRGFDPSYTGVKGSVSGTPLVDGSGQTGNTLNVTALPPSTLVFRDGDYFSVNGEFKRINEDVLSDSGGNAVLPFDPPIRNSPASGTAIVYTNPRCVMRLMASGGVPFNMKNDKTTSFSFTGIERIDV